jgi:hypothetical protein
LAFDPSAENTNVANNEFDPGNDPDLVRELHRYIGFALLDERCVPLIAHGRQLVHNAEPPEDVGDMNGCDPAGGRIAPWRFCCVVRRQSPKNATERD